MTPTPKHNTMGRLIAALTLVGTLFMATSAGTWAFWPCAFLWAVPPLVAARCLPVPAALLVIFVSGVGGRALAFLTPSSGLDLLVLALEATAALVPALLIDKLIVTRFPLRGIWAWPLLVAATCYAFRDTAFVELIAPVPDIDGAQLLAAGDPLLAVAVTGIVAQGFASMASVLNWHVPDPNPADVRERGVRIAALVSFAFLAAFAVSGVVGLP